ncbi:phosphoribosylglycinamide formyltransferase [Chloroflexota bacterium]
MEDGIISADIEFVFVDREYGEASASDGFLRLVEELGIPAVTLSSRRFEPELRKRDLDKWRRRFDASVMSKLAMYEKVDTIVLAGYMLIVSPDLCQKYQLVNLHPALPGGPIGTWQQVIDYLVQQRATESGIQIHKVTPELDRGPALSFCRFAVPGAENEEVLKQLIRQCQTQREVPLLLLTLRAIANRNIRTYGDRLVNRDGKQVSAIDLTDKVEAMLSKPDNQSAGL